MTNFFKSFSPLLKRLKFKKYLVEVILLIVAFIITITALVIYIKNNQETTDQDIVISPTPLHQDYGGQGKIFVDVSGAVKKPNIYEVVFGARLKDVVDKAGGLSDEADVVFFNRNFNLSRIVVDQDKIYIPSVIEINNGIFIQNQRTLDYISPSSGVINNTPTDNQLINLNSATLEELDQLPGIGQVTANKIITNRPYTAIDELLTKKVVNKSVYEKIKSQIIIQ